jgi:F1F0 ATPase subunit 2
MTDLLAFTLAFLTGAVLGFIFYGGLWLTVRKVVTAKRQPLWLPASLFVRILITFAGFFIICGANHKNFAACVAGFIFARLLAMKLVFVWKQKDSFIDKEVIVNAPQS